MSIPAPISVVIPAHNAEKFLKEAISSVLAQTLPVAEIILVADDCTDRTARIAAELGATVLELKRRNMAAGLNRGVGATSQPWIAFLDADDIWDKEKVALQWKAIQAFPKAALISCDVFTLIDGTVTLRSKRYLRARWKAIKNVTIADNCRYLERVNGEFLTRFDLTTSTVMLRRDVFANVGQFDESLSFGQTLEFFARVLAHYPIAFVERPLEYQRIHPQNHTKDFAAWWTSYLSIVNLMLTNPKCYPQGAGEAHREYLKETFHQSERVVAQGKLS